MEIKIIGITGCRSEYDIIYPVLRGLQEDGNFDVSVIACGAHLSDRFGYTLSEIKKDGITVADSIHNLIDSDREVAKAKGAGILAMGLSDSLDRLKPDYVMVAGDREEAVISGIVCTYLGIPLIHICGGDRTSPKAGDVDEPIRHATSKMASIHFTMNEEHKERLIKMGEEPWRVCNTGNPALDRFKEVESMDRVEILEYFGFKDEGDKDKPLCLVIQHVISGKAEEGAEQVDSTLKAVTGLESNCIINYPNTDIGSRRMVEVIERYEELPNVRITKHIHRKEFVNLLKNIDLLVGNSSLALLEGSFLKIPAINVGERNLNRMNGGNVVFVDVDQAKIRELVNKILFDKEFSRNLKNCKQAYGNGNTVNKTLEYIKNINRTKKELLAKDNTY